MKKFKKQMIRILSLCSATCFVLGACAESAKTAQNNVLNEGSGTYVEKTNGSLKTNQEDFYDENVIYQLPDSVALNTEISVIVTMSTKSLVKTYLSTESEDTVSDFIRSKEGKETSKQIDTERKSLINKLKKSGVDYKLGEQYNTVLSGFEITIQAKDFDKVSELFKNDAQLIVGEVYEPAITEVVTNEVDVYDTGIFTGLDDYKGDGVVVAVLDTGLDYTHSAFLPENFPEMGVKEDVAFELDDIKRILADKKMVAESSTSGLTANDVYLNKKVPYMYDYADKDPDVMPINSEHGTHVAGIIAGQDNTITGVAPNAQLAIMKVFSDTQTGAKTSWILAALEDCVNLGVDVINMSLGSGCGFARESDDDVSTTYDKTINQVYDSVRDAGISLIAAAGNDYTSTMNSEKNGSLSLTSNPDFGTVGSPSTYAAALSVASVDGVQTPYLKYGDEIIYFNEASTSDGKPRNFVEGLLDNYEAQTGIKTDSQEFEYITIPGIGRESDYMSDIDYTGKIVLVKRGTTTFEEKVRIALKVMGATGIIIYNNVSGMISMAVGDNVGPVCSIAQDEGEMLAANPTGKIVVSRNNTAGPFMSEFSGWGPTSDLQIKPEITAHGGEILSAMPGNGYERMSGTSMAAPNQAGAAALIRQYVRYSGQFGDNYEELTTSEACEVTAIVNQLMMSTADILNNKNGLPYAVRKQGAGLVNLQKATTAEAYLTTFDKTGALMDKTKLELGDDKNKSGVYTMELAINNISASTVSYNVNSIIFTEGVAKTYTGHDEQTVTQEGYLLNPTTTVKEVNGVAATSNTVTVDAKETVKIKVEIVLSAEDKAYLDESFANGMYVEGFIKLDAQGDTKVNLSVPMLAFYGDWTQAPIFDEEYYDTHKDELNEGLNHEDKVMADAYATRVLGGLYSDYITALGTYYFKQDPKATPIAANKEYIAISNQYDDTDEEGKGNRSTVNSIHSIYAGLLRNCREVNISIVEDSTGEEVFYRSEKMLRKSAYRGGGISASAIDVEFSSIEHDLKNNTKYTVTVTAYIDYGENADQKNERNTFTFPLYIDFQAPAVTDVRYRSEYDRTTKKTKLFADIDVYDNHYAMAMQLGQITEADENSEYTYEMDTFGKYFTPIYSSYNSTSTVTVELTDYVDRLKDSVGAAYDEDGKNNVVYNNNSFIAICYDYAMNSATYEIRLPDEILSAAFTEEEIQLTVGRTKDLTSIMSVYPSDSWVQTLDFVSENPAVASIVNNVVVGKGEGETVINAVKRDANNNERIVASIPITVAPGSGFGTSEVVNKFELTGYYTNKAYYSVSSDDREIGETDSTNAFGKDGAKLSMYPSESVTIEYILDSYYPDETKVVMESMNEDIAIIREMKDKNGNPIIDDKTGEVKLEIVAQAKGNTDISIDVYQLVDGEWEMTMTSESVSIEVKDPFTVSGMYLMSYKGLGGVVEIPADRGITAIYQYAFSNYEYIPKDENDEINEEDPFYIKPWYIGEDTITKVIIPEGVTAIESYAFANLTALEEVVLPKSLVRIGVGAFTGCVKLKKINLEYAKFINEEAFKDCPLTSVKLDSAVSIGNYTFQNTKIGALTLPASSQSLGIGAFADNAELRTLTFRAPKMKIGSYAFKNCPKLNNVVINASVIASYAFYDCITLESVTIGKDVAVIGEFAFTGTNVSQFAVEAGGVIEVDEENSANLLKNDELILVAPKGATMDYVIGSNVTSIAAGAFAGNTKIQKVTALNVEVVGEYAFAECLNLKSVDMPNVETVGDYAFAGTSLTAMPDSEVLTEIGDYAFAGTLLTEVTIMPDAYVGEYAFGGFVVMESGRRVNRYTTETLMKVTVGNGAVIGEGAFNAPIYMATYENTESLYYYKPYTYYLQDKDGNYISEDGEIVANKADAKQYTYYTYDFSKEGAGIAPSILKEVYIGEEVTIGKNSFSGNAKLQKLEIGSGTTVEDYAFMNSAFYDENVLQEVDLSGVVSIGQYAFSGTSLYDYQVIKTESKTEDAPKEFIVNAYKLVYVHGENGEEGEEKITHYQTTKFAPIFKRADISGATYIGEGAFAYNEDLEEVIFSDQLEEIPAYAFALCSSLAKADLTASIKTINEYAFYLTAFSGESVDLKNVETIGEAAFASSKITKVTFKDGAVIGESAFKDCEFLTGVDVSKVKEIGAEAFYNTALTFADLTGATIVGDFAFGESQVTGVKLGANIQDLGENPFYACAIETYGTVEDVYFNGEKVESEVKPIETYNVNDKVLVINGVLYQKVKAGLELISYPMNKVGKAYVVEEGTTRISARALAGSMLEDVTLPTTLKAVGDKALYDCKNLSVVVFKSYYAPVLEEDYDQSRISYDNLAMTGTIGEYVGIGIVKYYMWNATSNYTNFYFGANFVDFIGDIDKHVVMVKPANGRNYSTFVFSQYFHTMVEGSNAATAETISVISIINSLPDEISLSDEDAIVAARAAYDKILTLEQKSLVANYDKLTSAESTLEYLKSRVETPVDPETPPTEEPKEDPVTPPTEEPKDNKTGYVIAIVALSIVVVGLVAFFVCDKFIFSKRNNKSEE